jgi:hypothetical protein
VCRGYEQRIRDVYDGRIAVLSRASDQVGEGGNLCTSSQVHEGHPQEVQDGRLEAHVNIDEYDYSARCGRGRRPFGLGVPEHDRLPLVLDGNEAGHPVFCVSVHSFSGVAEDFTSAGRQEDLQVSSIHS